MIALEIETIVLIGLALMLLGGVLLHVRSRFREKSQQDDDKDALHVPLVEVSWSEKFECGHPVIDAQHRRLFGIGNELVDAVLSKTSKSNVEALLFELADHIEEHFSTEEKILAEVGPPISKGHHDIHHSLLTKAKGLRDQYRMGDISLHELVSFVTRDVVTHHILQEDLTLFGEPSVDFRSTIGPLTKQNASLTGNSRFLSVKEDRDNVNSVFMIFREDSELGREVEIMAPFLDKATPNKVLQHAFPHVWQRICVFSVEPKSLEKYLVSLSLQDHTEKRAGFTLEALKEIADIRQENAQFLLNPDTKWETGFLNP